MNFYLVFLLLFLCATSRGQQYHIVKEIPTNDFIKSDDDQNRICFKVYGNEIFQIRVINKAAQTYGLKVTRFNLESGMLMTCDTIAGIPTDFGSIQDFIVNKKRLLITGYKRYIMCDLNKIATSITTYPDSTKTAFAKKHPFERCEIINDSLALLYIVYNYHPLDGNAGVHLSIFNMNTQQFDGYKMIKFPGIAASHLTNNWVTIIKNNIYIVTPLTGKIFKLDKKLNVLDTSSVPMFTDKELADNQIYQSEIDSTIDNETNRILSVANKYPKDSLPLHRAEYASDVYGKNFISSVIKEVRENRTFINNLVPVDDSLILLEISRPGYVSKFRDLIFYDPSRKKITKKYSHVACAPADSLAKPEDLFTINFAYSKPFLPYIHKNFVYYYSQFPLSSFARGSYDDVSLKLFNSIKNTGYKWTMIKYQLD